MKKKPNKNKFTLLDSFIFMSNKNVTIKPNMVIYNSKVFEIILYSSKSNEKYRFLSKIKIVVCSQAQARTGI